MATEKLKVFANMATATSTTQVNTVGLVTTSSSEQAVLKTITFEAADAKYPVTATVKNGNASLTAPKTSKAGITNVGNLSGSQIVDVSAAVSIEFNTGADITPMGYADAMYFDQGSGMYRFFETTTTIPRTSAVRTYANSVGKFSSTARLGSLNAPASSAYGIIDASGNNMYFQNDFSNVVRAYNSAGALITHAGGNTYFNVQANTYGSCTDGTYIYGKNNSNDNTLQKIKISDDTSVYITMSSSFTGQASNQGGFTLYHDGHVYIHETGGSNDVRRINVTTGAVTELTGCNVGSYVAGAIVTQALDGKFYIIECGGQGTTDNSIIDLATFTRTSVTCASLGTSTEYGNLGMEIQPGVGIFFYNDNAVFIDVNTMTASASTFTRTSFGFTRTVYSNNQGSSFANIPLYLKNEAAIARSTTYKAYADGVLIEGVA
tara:strand:+ start:116 stop:1417 length:1302 start_codon:yes stop_codon:yes gene_type:complete